MKKIFFLFLLSSICLTAFNQVSELTDTKKLIARDSIRLGGVWRSFWPAGSNGDSITFATRWYVRNFISGPGTLNYIPIFTGAYTLGNSPLSYTSNTLKALIGTNTFGFSRGAGNVSPYLFISPIGEKSVAVIAGEIGSGVVFDTTGFFNIGGDSKSNIDIGNSNGGISYARVFKHGYFILKDDNLPTTPDNYHLHIYGNGRFDDTLNLQNVQSGSPLTDSILVRDAAGNIKQTSSANVASKIQRNTVAISDTVTLPANTMVKQIVIQSNNFSRRITIGTTLHGNDLFDATVRVGVPYTVILNRYFGTAQVLYVERYDTFHAASFWDYIIFIN